MTYKYRNAHLSNIVIDGVNCTRYFTFPFTIQETLDESLDSAMIQLTGMEREEPFKPFTDAELGTDADGRIDMLVANDEVTEIFGRGLYNHQITLIEPTKLLERYVMGAKAFTNHAARMYTSSGQYATASLTEEGKTTSAITTAYYDQIIASDKIYIRSVEEVWAGVGSLATDDKLKFFSKLNIYYMQDKTSDKRLLIKSVESPVSAYDNQFLASFWVDLTDGQFANTAGYYMLEYILKYGIFLEGAGSLYYKDVILGVGFTAIPDSNVLTVAPYTIQEVLSTLNRQVRPLKEGENPSFTFSFDEGQQARIESTRAPEFKFPSGQTFWENLREVFKFMHWIPRLKRNRDGKYVICADELGGNEYADMSKGERVSGQVGISAADYADALEANVSNLLNADDELEGSIITPHAGGGITIRSDSARIGDNEGSYIPTPYPIEKLLKLEAFATFDDSSGGTSNQTLDLTPYVFEKTEYDTLSSFSGVFPYSKTYALYYTQGTRNIQGLFYRAEDAVNDFSSLQKRFAITNILNAVLGTNQSNRGYHSITYRVTYVPTITARVRQYKTNIDGRGANGTLALSYNQSANKLAARAFGENMRGQIAMLGNKTRKATYLFGSYSDIPKPGLLFDGKNYISTVTTRVHPDFCVSEIGLSEGYNELGGYLELNNAHRQFEIPGECERHYHIDELCVISTNSAIANTIDPLVKFIAGSTVRNYIMMTFSFGQTQSDTDITSCTAMTYDNNNSKLQEVYLPVVSTSIGTSLYFGFRYEDNFSAGSSSVENNNKRYTEYVPYGDALARARYLEFSLCNGRDPQRRSWLEQAHALPKIVSRDDMNAVLTTPRLCYDKDAADGGDVSYQLHFVSDSGFIIGEALARLCPLVRSNPNRNAAGIYFYTKRMNELTGYIAPATENGYCGESELDVSTVAGIITVKSMPNFNFKSWRIMKDMGGGKFEFLLGANSDTVPKNIYFGFKRP